MRSQVHIPHVKSKEVLSKEGVPCCLASMQCHVRLWHCHAALLRSCTEIQLTNTLHGTGSSNNVAVLCAQDYWLSLDRYINWSSTAKSTNDFYTDWNCRQMYKDHIEHYVNRRNTYNGRLYKEDPTIFYWDLINEPRW